MSLARKVILASLTLILTPAITVLAQPAAQPSAAPQPWSNTALDADTRADLMIHEMTLDEKIQLVHGAPNHDGPNSTPGFNGGAGVILGIPRLGLPAINMADSAVGITKGESRSRYSTLLPSTIGMSASWDPDTAFLYGSIIGHELREQGYNMSIGGGVDLIREPRNGRNFEYSSEDPILSGTMIGHLGLGIQSAHIMGDIKHYVMNDQETGRDTYNALIDNRTMRETDLLAFQIAIGLAKPAGVMCAYNRINGDYSCENDYTLNQVLKRDWKFQGFVLSDWGGTHSTVKAALAGLDQDMPGSDKFFSDPLKQAILDGKVPQARLDDMVHRIIRSMFINDVIDHPTDGEEVVDPFRGRDEARKIEEKSLVLLQNTANILPLSPTKIRSIAIIGGHADAGILSGGGSAQVNPPGGNAVQYTSGSEQQRRVAYFPSSPLHSMQELAPDATITYNPGTDNAQAAKAAASAKLAIVFVTQPMEEGTDRATLSLPDDQDALVEAVVAANPNTIVVLETGGPVSMPWASKVKGIVETWFPGIGGGQAIANVLFGRVNPSGKLPVTFAASDSDLPHLHVSGIDYTAIDKGVSGKHKETRDFPVDYNVEGMAVGYRWFQQKNIKPLFPFGFGLSYTHFAYSKLNASATTVSFDLHNDGHVAGDEIAEVYVTLPTSAGEPFRKLAGWKRVSLAPGATQRVEISIDPLYLSTFSTDTNKWSQPTGDFLIEAGGSSSDLPLHQSIHLATQ